MLSPRCFLCLVALFVSFVLPCFAKPQKTYERWWTDNEERFELFDGWLGDSDARSRVLSRQHILRSGYTSVLDVPCGTCTEYFGYQRDNIAIQYTGLDITHYLVVRALNLGIDAYEGSIENIPFPDDCFDLVYIRHLLEHLEHYQLALSEAIRVAQKEVLVVFFIPPSESEPDKIITYIVDELPIYHNQYNREDIIAFVKENSKVNRIEWEPVDGTAEVIMHIYVE